jgi:hypothetical protein
MNFRTKEDTVIWRRKLWIAICGGIVLGRGFEPVVRLLDDYDDHHDDKPKFKQYNFINFTCKTYLNN